MGKMYIGTKNGKKEVAMGGSFNKTSGQQIFTQSGTFTVPAGVNFISVFLVGGGQSGGYQMNSYRGNDGSTCYQYYGAYGGASGYTRTIPLIPVTPGSTHTVTVGSGGVCPLSTPDIKTSCSMVAGGYSAFDDYIAYGGNNNGAQGYNGIVDRFYNIVKGTGQQDGRHAFGIATNTEYAHAGNPISSSRVLPSTYGDGGCVYWVGGGNGQTGNDDMIMTYRDGKPGIVIVKW